MSQLKISTGQHSDKGRKETNQDFHGVYIPNEPQRSSKGIAIVLADGVSSSDVSHIASETAVTGFLEDYFCTSEAWSVKKSAQQVLMAVNSWLYSQTQQSQYRYDKDRGYVCTLSAMVIKSNTAHLFHVGDARVYRLRADGMEQLTNDHRLWVSQEQKSYLSRALGVHPQLEIDYQALTLEKGDRFFFATDGVHEFVSPQSVLSAINEHHSDLDMAARTIVSAAFENGSADNLTVQIVRIEELPERNTGELQQQLIELPLPPELTPRMTFDGYTVIREIHISSRSHVYLALDPTEDGEPATPVVIKTPSIDLQADPAYLERFLLEDWIARRINNAHVVKPSAQTRKRNYLYTVTEYIDGQTLSQWMIDNPKPSLETVRGIVAQIAKGLLAFHRLEMLHQDLRPANIMIDRTGTVKILDFGSTRVAGITESATLVEQSNLLGTAQYTAPEYFLGEAGTSRSDLFSLGVIAYHMLSGKLPYGAEVAKSRTRAAQRQLIYNSVLDDQREIPAWFDDVLRKATHPDPNKRYEELSEFVYDLRHPSKASLSKARAPLIERNPVAFWKGVSLILVIVIAILLLK
jgi:serine/threonine protein phosphatase PrpC